MSKPYRDAATRTIIDLLKTWCINRPQPLHNRSHLLPIPIVEALSNANPEIDGDWRAKFGPEQVCPGNLASRRQTTPADTKTCDGDPASGEFHAG